MLLAGAIVFMCVAVPFVLPVLVPLLISFLYIRRRYIRTSREVGPASGTCTISDIADAACLLGLQQSFEAA